MDWIESIGGGLVVLVVGAIVWMAKVWITHIFEKRRETYKARLSAEAEIKSVEHQTRFSKAHEQRMQAIKDIHAALMPIPRCFWDLVKVLGSSEDPPIAERESKAKAAFEMLSECFGRNRIYLEKDICDEIEGLLRLLEEVYWLWEEHGNRDRGSGTTDSMNPLREAKSIVQGKVPQIITKLEGRFREMQGIVKRDEDQV